MNELFEGRPLIALIFLCVLAASNPPAGLADSYLPIDIWSQPPFSSKPILPDSNLGAPEQSPSIEVWLTPGETESASFVVRSRRAMGKLAFSSGALRDSSGQATDAVVQLRYVMTWYQAGGAWRQPRKKDRAEAVLVPELLVRDPMILRVDRQSRSNELRVTVEGEERYVNISRPANLKDPVVHLERDFRVQDAYQLRPISLEPQINQQVFVSISAPQSARAGDYEGEITVREQGTEQSMSIALRVRVLPFVLERSRLLYGVYYRGQLNEGPATVTSDLKTKAQLATEFADIAEHGIEYTTIYQGNINSYTKSHIKTYRAESALEAYLGVHRRSGLAMDRAFYLGIGSVGAARQTSYAERLLSRFVESGYGQVYFYGKDEAAGESLRAQRESWRIIHAIGAKVFAANNKHDLLDTDMARELDIAILARDLRPSEASQLRELGVDKVLSYNRPQSAVENPEPFRRNYGFELIAAGYDGAMIYAYQHGFGSVWNDFDHFRWRDHCLTYPSENGVISTLAWEALREAIDDVRYFATLESAIDSLHGSAHPDAVQIRENAANLTGKLSSGAVWTPDEIRQELIELILTAQTVQGLALLEGARQ